MGLNWAQGAQNAAAGLDRLSQNKMAQSEMLYKDMAEKNRMRFEEKQSQDQRDFLSEQADIKWGREMPLEYGKLGLQGQQIEATTELARRQQEATEENNRAMRVQAQERIGLEEQRNAASEDQAAATETRLTVEQRIKQHNSEMARLDKQLEAERAGLNLLTPEGKRPGIEEKIASLEQMRSEKEQQYDIDQEIIKLPKAQQAGYEAMSGFLGKNPSNPTMTHEVSLRYAKLPGTEKEKQALVEATTLELMKAHPDKYSTRKAATAAAVMKLTNSVNFIDPSANQTPPEGAPAAEAPAAKDRMATEAPAPKPVANSQRGRDAKLVDGAEKRREESRDTTARSLDKDSREKEILELARDMARKNKVNFSGKNKEQFIVAAEKIYENRYAQK